jgi:hypothetical protein
MIFWMQKSDLKGTVLKEEETRRENGEIEMPVSDLCLNIGGRAKAASNYTELGPWVRLGKTATTMEEPKLPNPTLSFPLSLD